MTEEKEGERRVLCPLNGCDQEVLARGINLHIRQSSDEIHGQQGKVPEGVGLDELETKGEEPVQVNYPQNRKEDTEHILCPFCYEIFKGNRGIKTHLSQTSGKGQHPDNAVEEYDLNKPDRKGNMLLNKSESASNRAKRYVEYLVSEGDIEEAKRAKRFLFNGRK